MKQRILAFIVVIISLLSLIPAYAQDNLSTPTPGTRADNECYAGGTMAGKCDHGFHADGSVTPDEVQWAWKAGWYLARFNDGIITRDQVPQEFWILLPGITISTSTAPECYTVGKGTNFLLVACVIGNTVIDYEDNVDQNGTLNHRETLIFWIEADSNVGDGGHCTFFASDLSSFTRTPATVWMKNTWLSHGFNPTDDVCAIAKYN